MTEVYLTPTMDAEPPNTEISAHARAWSATGPESYAESHSSVAGYIDICDELGYPATIFAHPEAAEAHADLLVSAESAGACLGLHLHPYKMNEAYHEALGDYSVAMQRKILTEAIRRWADAIGTRPKWFRAGGTSMNDKTFELLEDLGFEGGSTTLPGYVNPPRRINWEGAELYPHRAHHQYRQAAGDGAFIEVPFVVDFSRPRHGTKGPNHRGYERLEILPGTTEEMIRAAGSNILDQYVEDDPSLPVLLPNAHNNVDYGDPDGDGARLLRFELEYLESTCEDRGIDLTAGTLADVVSAFERLETA